jgi:hypothetical protein
MGQQRVAEPGRNVDETLRSFSVMNPLMTEALQQITRAPFSRSNRMRHRRRGALFAIETAVAGNPPPSANPLASRAPHFGGRAKRIIYLHLTGSPPHLDLFDYKNPNW